MKPVFTEVAQIAIVVRDLDATLKRYEEDYGIGPWQIHQLKPGDSDDMREYGKRVEASNRFATTMVGGVMWELIQPLDADSLWGRFLAEKGEGVHHIAVATPSYDDALAAEAKRGDTLALNGTFGGIKVSYLPTDRKLGVLLEVFTGWPGAKK